MQAHGIVKVLAFRKLDRKSAQDEPSDINQNIGMYDGEVVTTGCVNCPC